MKVLIRNIKGLVQAGENAGHKRAGSSMDYLPILDNSYLLLDNNRIQSFGTMEHCPETDAHIIDATDKFVLPTFVDSHTHIVFAASRETEFVMRIKGATYEEIAKNGDGILNSAHALEQCSEDDLFNALRYRGY